MKQLGLVVGPAPAENFQRQQQFLLTQLLFSKTVIKIENCFLHS